MSSKSIRLRQQETAQRSFEHHLCELQVDISRGVPVRHLWVRVELLEELVGKTGGTLVTEIYREKLGAMVDVVGRRDIDHRARIQASPLRLLRSHCEASRGQ